MRSNGNRGDTALSPPYKVIQRVVVRSMHVGTLVETSLASFLLSSFRYALLKCGRYSEVHELRLVELGYSSISQLRVVQAPRTVLNSLHVGGRYSQFLLTLSP